VETGEVEKLRFGRGERAVTRKEMQWVQTGVSDCVIDGTRFARNIQAAIEELNKEGYEVVTVTMTTSGQYDWRQKLSNNPAGGYGWGYGFSYTSGANIIAKRMTTKDVS